MGKRINLKEAVNLIWETAKITEEQSTNGELPYLLLGQEYQHQKYYQHMR